MESEPMPKADTLYRTQWETNQSPKGWYYFSKANETKTNPVGVKFKFNWNIKLQKRI